jgi:hypothetical protein
MEITAQGAMWAVLIGQVCNSVCVIGVVMWKFGYLTAIFKNFQPHKHVNGHIIYSDKFPPTREQMNRAHGD